jgi:hypothetical protein
MDRAQQRRSARGGQEVLDLKRPEIGFDLVPRSPLKLVHPGEGGEGPVAARCGSPEHEHADAGDQCNSAERCHRSKCDLDAAHVLHGLRGSPKRLGKVISLGVRGTRA